MDDSLDTQRPNEHTDNFTLIPCTMPFMRKVPVGNATLRACKRNRDTYTQKHITIIIHTSLDCLGFCLGSHTTLQKKTLTVQVQYHTGFLQTCLTLQVRDGRYIFAGSTVAYLQILDSCIHVHVLCRCGSEDTTKDSE